MKSQTYGISHTEHYSNWSYEGDVPVLHSEFPHTLNCDCDTIMGILIPGLFIPCITYPYTLCCIPCLRLFPCDITLATCAKEAVSAYRANRENGKFQDNPSTAFSQDGEYTWTQPDSGCSSVTYTEGLKDRIWMKEKDRNYLNRLEKEKIFSHTEEIDTATQRDAIKTTLKPEKVWNKPLPNATDEDYFQEHYQIGEDDIMLREKGEEEEDDLQNVSFPSIMHTIN